MDISRNEEQVLKYLESNKISGPMNERSIEISGMSDREISSAVSWLESKALIDVSKESSEKVQLGEEGEEYLKLGLPEERLLASLKDKKEISVDTCMKTLGVKAGKIAIAQLSKFGIKPKFGVIHLGQTKEAEEEIKKRRQFLKELRDGGNPSQPAILEHFKKRENVIVIKVQTNRTVEISSEGEAYLSGHVEGDKIDSLTPEIIANRSWKGKKFRSYDLNSPVEKITGVSKHPMTYLIDRVRQIFLSMGFKEMAGKYVEYSGWNMDALFIPQDHPARDMQDTFYLRSDKKFEFQHPEVIKILRKVHEEGMEGYTGWQYKWSEDKARELLLRTHTTVSTIRHLYENKEPPLAIFSVEKVFRHESVDWKHLAELHQIEGAVHSKEANVATLKWLMRVFYESLGFKDIKFIPSYYPYTEPSIDVVVKIKGKEVELGGSGVFRPEVTKPLGLKEPVIAWGLGLERLAMIYYNLSDIREIYNSDLDWLRNFKLVT